jgi:enoyl-CoA hydratase
VTAVAQAAFDGAEEPGEQLHTGPREDPEGAHEERPEDREILEVIAFAEGVEKIRGLTRAEGDGQAVARADLGCGFDGRRELQRASEVAERSRSSAVLTPVSLSMHACITIGENRAGDPMSDESLILIDRPAEFVRRLTLNRPKKRNALNNALRGELFAALQEGDADPEVRVTILRGAGKCFSAGYDLSANNMKDQPYYTAPGDANWPRHVVAGWFAIWDLAKPVIAQVHGYCLAGGSELATACDLVYVAEDAQIGYPPVRTMSPPDMQYHPWLMGLRGAMEVMLTGDSISGSEAARLGFANRAFPAEELEQQVLELAQRVAKIPSDLQQLNKRSVHRAMDIMGMRSALRAGTEIQALGFHQRTAKDYFKTLAGKPLTKALDERDEQFGDYRTSHDDEEAGG